METTSICLSILAFTSIISFVTSDVIVNTPAGPIRGLAQISNGTGKPYQEFLGIPYAKPPVGKLRFRKTEPVEKWSKTYDATSFGAACLQGVSESFPDFIPKQMSEDCLFLNVYVPKTTKRKLPVMIWIHGGGLFIGWSHQYDASIMATEGEVIVVTINYRLDILGFFSSGHPSALGNYGLWDQKMAFKWVHDNIAAFGGDPNAVTIFGQSGGGWSVSLQVLIPSNRGLFQRAIVMSGGINQYSFAHDRNSKLTNERLIETAQRTQCPVNDMYKFVECLRQLDEKKVLSDVFDFSKLPTDRYDMTVLPHSPVFDGDLFRTNPFKDLNDPESDVSKFFRSIDFITGYNSNEMQSAPMMFLPQLQEHFNFTATEAIPAKFLCEGIVKPFVEKFYEKDPVLNEKLCSFYTTANSADEQSMKTLDIINDVMFRIPAAKQLDSHVSSTGSTYQYVYSREPETFMMGPPPKFAAKGTAHGNELEYLFDYNVIFPSFARKYSSLSEEEKMSSKTLIEYFTSFAKTGVPEVSDSAAPWKQFDTKNRNFLDIDKRFSLKQNDNLDAVKLWTEHVPADHGPKPFEDFKNHDEL